MSEQVLDKETWPAEAEAAINDIRKHVNSAQVSSKVRSTNQKIYINLTTLENAEYCVEMSALGFRVVGRKYDDTSLSTIENMNYETPYALLNNISQKYRESFGGELMNKLLHLAKKSEG
ncbi:GSK3B-interacting protein [Vanessa tameamea]|uniref:GSK3B-interacting protein n=1 Tax=Vanessa tameamea TaxID=334116 RepID=A0A8B8HLF2_VANTA|nr:GSK3B-interacting protein isoform X2 [Vanessa tameamea]XP_047529372.1 GSK3B-interacting protein [Vanessa atalanta]XP_047529373.1 GSK3B-interacting protein [Vanessa atalanta]